MKDNGDIRRMFVESVQRMMSRWGYTPSDGKVYALLLLSNRPMRIQELAKMAGLSRSAVSLSLSKLESRYLIKMHKEGRTKLFTAVPSFFSEFLRQPREMLEHEVLPAIKALEDLNRTDVKNVLTDLNNLRCVLEKIIELEGKLKCAGE
ncbi:MAG: ArsR family transcriptional regulator [Thermococci archaeon]|nr:ArsR family transcriptional regulator [Thermococci archaeon]